MREDGEASYRGNIMDNNKIEFSALSALYTTTKNQFPYLEEDIKDLEKIKSKLDNYGRQLRNLKRQKASQSNNLNAFLNPYEAKSFYGDIDLEIDAINQEIKKIKEDDLFKRKDDIEQASNELNSYIEQANSNFEFQISLRESLIDIYSQKIPQMEEATKIPGRTLLVIDKLKELSKTDPNLSNYLSIDADKQKLEVFNTVINQYSSIQAKDPKEQATRQNVLVALKKEASALEKGISSKGIKLQKYIVDHKREFGIPSNTTHINFNDLNSELYFISQISDPKSSVTMQSTEDLFTAELGRMNTGIETAKKSIDYAKRDILELKVKREKELQDLSLYPKVGKLATLKRLAKAPFKIFKNILYGKKHPFKGVLEKPVMPEAPTRAKVVDSDNNFLDAYKTEIGEDAMFQIVNNYNKRVKEERQNNSRQQDSHDDLSL